ncbi:hypothetical protein ABLV18_27495 [Klebsiella sp. CN_Kp114]|uniref:hypothetical protein n=1 Tax=unclassified Klebsiella TaxID=2608929 RepID=UPI0032B49401
MKVKELIDLLQKADPEAVVLVAGYETMFTNMVASPDLVKTCKTVPHDVDSMYGNRELSTNGEPSVWIGWSKDYRGEAHIEAIEDPDLNKAG